jgi:hypothetical protein
MRVSQPLYEVGMTMGGHRQEDRSAAAPVRFATRPFRRGGG